MTAFLLGYGVLTIAGCTAMALLCRAAVDGYQDESGFHALNAHASMPNRTSSSLAFSGAE